MGRGDRLLRARQGWKDRGRCLVVLGPRDYSAAAESPWDMEETGGIERAPTYCLHGSGQFFHCSEPGVGTKRPPRTVVGRNIVGNTEHPWPGCPSALPLPMTLAINSLICKMG